VPRALSWEDQRIHCPVIGLPQRPQPHRIEQCEIVAAKQHKHIFKNLLTDNRPLQATDNRVDVHRKISAAIVGHFSRFQMKKKNRLSDINTRERQLGY
jgi:predicted metal-dependent phosphoesterase TrpH